MNNPVLVPIFTKGMFFPLSLYFSWKRELYLKDRPWFRFSGKFIGALISPPPLDPSLGVFTRKYALIWVARL